MSFEDMGPSWVPVREAVAAGTLRANDKMAVDVAARFDALIRYACLRLGRQLGTEVTPVLTRQELADPAVRTAAVASALVKTGSLTAAIRISNAISEMRIQTDLRSSRVTCSFDIGAPRDGRAVTRINWLTRQLKESSGSTRIEAFVQHGRGGMAELLRDVRETPGKLVVDASKEIKSFSVAQIHSVGTKRGAGRGAFIDSMLDAIDATYEDVGQRLKAWAALPPRLRSDDEVVIEPQISPDLPSAALSSQDDEPPVGAAPA